MQKMCISKWLYNIIKSVNSDSAIIPNGFDFEKFKLTKPIETRDKFQIAMLYHISERKGVDYSLEALDIVKKNTPNYMLHFWHLQAQGETAAVDDFPLQTITTIA